MGRALAAPDAGTLAAVLTGRLPLEQAAGSGVEIEGGKRDARRFLALFPMPEPCPGSEPA